MGKIHSRQVEDEFVLHKMNPSSEAQWYYFFDNMRLLHISKPTQDPLAIIGIAAIFLPFILLGIAIALGLVDVNGGR